MAFNRPTLKQIVDRIKADFKSGLSLSTIIRRSFLDVMAKAYGAASHVLHGFIAFAVRQLFTDTMDIEFLIRDGTIFGVPRNEAVFAELNITITGTTGGTLLQGRPYQRSDGVQYGLKADVIVPAAGDAPGIIVALVADDASNLDDGSIVSLTSPEAGVVSDAVVDTPDGTAVEGEDQEGIEDYRIRVLERKQAPPAGGKVTDYIAFAKTVTGVTRVWVSPGLLGEGTVGVYFVEDGEIPIFPSAPKIAEVLIAVNEQKPVTADAFVISPIERSVDVEIQIKPNTAAVQAAVTAELQDMIFREAQVADAADPDKVGTGGTFSGDIPLSKYNEAISLADGEEDHILNLPAADVEAATGELVSLGAVTFITLP